MQDTTIMQANELGAPNLSATEVFQRNAADYHRQLMSGVGLSGELPEFFASARVAATAALLNGCSDRFSRVLDFGCGVGTAAPFLAQVFPSAVVIGSDIATQALAIAGAKHPAPKFRWVEDLMGIEPDSIDLVYCNGVFHHIAPQDRDAVLRRVCRLIRPGGMFALWENNPWNVGTRWVMSRIPFDRDAICLSQFETARRFKLAGMDVQYVQHHFFFPRCLAWMRHLEPLLRLVPLGAQYLVLAKRPK